MVLKVIDSPNWTDLLLPFLALAAFMALGHFTAPTEGKPLEWLSQVRKLTLEKKYDEGLLFNQKLLEQFPRNHVYLEQAAQLNHSLGRG